MKKLKDAKIKKTPSDDAFWADCMLTIKMLQGTKPCKKRKTKQY